MSITTKTFDKNISSAIRHLCCCLSDTRLFSSSTMNSFRNLLLLILLLVLGMATARPTMQQILVNNHLWEVPAGAGWEDVVKEAESIRQLLRECISPAECHQIVEGLRAIFNRHTASQQYLQTDTDDDDDLWNSIFKWG